MSAIKTWRGICPNAWSHFSHFHIQAQVSICKHYRTFPDCHAQSEKLVAFRRSWSLLISTNLSRNFVKRSLKRKIHSFPHVITTLEDYIRHKSETPPVLQTKHQILLIALHLVNFPRPSSNETRPLRREARIKSRNRLSTRIQQTCLSSKGTSNDSVAAREVSSANKPRGTCAKKLRSCKTRLFSIRYKRISRGININTVRLFLTTGSTQVSLSQATSGSFIVTFLSCSR